MLSKPLKSDFELLHYVICLKSVSSFEIHVLGFLQ